MSGHIYILTDGTSTKIGITTNFDRRMSSYKTHNPNAQLFKSYPCSIDEAKKIETAIKHVFRNALASESKEWFSVGPEEVDWYVSTLLLKPSNKGAFPSLHGVPLSNKAYDLKRDISTSIKANGDTERSIIERNKAAFSELFAERFSLGLPEHNLPNDAIVVKDGPCIDTRHCAPPERSLAVVDAIRANSINLPHDDHAWRFFNLAKLGSGYFVAICTAVASMPYLKAFKNETRQEIVSLAGEFGWHCTFHNDWSWHYPEETALIVYQPKTPTTELMRLWDGSFRKWVIERRESLKLECFHDTEKLESAIYNIVHDNTFPLSVNSYAGFCDDYLRRFLWVTDDDSDEFWLKSAYEFLYGKWRTATGIEP